MNTSKLTALEELILAFTVELEAAGLDDAELTKILRRVIADMRFKIARKS